MTTFAALLPFEKLEEEKWANLLENSPQQSVFLEHWYLKALETPVHIIVLKNEKDEYTAALLLPLNSKGIVNYALQPVFTRYGGPLFREEPTQNTYQKYSNIKKQAAALIDQIPNKLLKLELHLSPEFDYPLPFLHSGFTLVPRFTFSLLLSDINTIRKNYNPAVLKKIRKSNNSGYSFAFGENEKEVISLLELNEKAGKTLLHPRYYNQLRNIMQVAMKNNSGFPLTALSPDGKLAAAGFFLQDKRTTYFLAGFVHPEHRQSGVMNAFVDKAIELSIEKTTTFDFLGSMNESIESFFRSFGAVPMPYTSIKRERNFVSTFFS